MFIVATDNPKDIVARVAHAARIGATIAYQQYQKQEQEQETTIVAVVPRSTKTLWRAMLFPIWSYICSTIPEFPKVKQTFAVASIESVANGTDVIDHAFIILDFADMTEVVHADVLRKMSSNISGTTIIMAERPILRTPGIKVISRLASSTSVSFAIEHAFVAVPTAAPIVRSSSEMIKECATTDDVDYKRTIKFRVLADTLKQPKYTKTASILFTSHSNLAVAELKDTKVTVIKLSDETADVPSDTTIVIIETSNTDKVFRPAVLQSIRRYEQSKSNVNVYIDVSETMSVDVFLYVATIVYQPSLVVEPMTDGPAKITYLASTPSIPVGTVDKEGQREILAATERAVRMCLDGLRSSAGNLQSLRFGSSHSVAVWTQDTVSYVSQIASQIKTASKPTKNTEDVIVFFQFVARFMRTQMSGYYKDAANYVSRVAQQDSVVAVPATKAAAEIVNGTAPVSLNDPSRSIDLTGPADEAMVAAAAKKDDKESPASMFINGSTTLEEYLRGAIVDRIMNRAQIAVEGSDRLSLVEPYNLSDADNLAAAIRQRRDALYASAENPIIDCLNESIMAETGIVDKLINAIGPQPLTGETMEPIAAAYAANALIDDDTSEQPADASDERLLNQMVALNTQDKLNSKFASLRDALKTALLEAKTKYLSIVESVTSMETSVLDQAMAQVSKLMLERQDKINMMASAAMKNYSALKKSQAQQLQSVIPDLQRLLTADEDDNTDKNIGSQALDMAEDLAAIALSGTSQNHVSKRIEQRKLYETHRRAENIKLKRFEVAKKVEAIVTKFEQDRAQIVALFETAVATEDEQNKAQVSAVLAPVKDIFARNKDKLNPEIEAAINEYASVVLASKSQFLANQRQFGREYYIDTMITGDEALRLDCDVPETQKMAIKIEVDDDLVEPKETVVVKEIQKPQKHNVYLLSVVSEYLSKWVSAYHFSPVRQLGDDALELKTFYQAIIYHTYYFVLRVEPKTKFVSAAADVVFKSLQKNMDPGAILNEAITAQETTNGASDILTINKLSQLLHYWYDAVISYVFKQMRALRRKNDVVRSLLWSRVDKDAAAAERSKVAVLLANMFAHRACVRIESDLVSFFIQAVVFADVNGSEIKTHAMSIIGAPTSASERLANTDGCWLIMNSTESLEAEDSAASAASEAGLFIVYPVLYTDYETDDMRDTTNTTVAVSTKILKKSFVSTGGAKLV